MTSKQPPWTREEFDAKLAELQADPAKAVKFKADLVAKIRKGFEDLSKRKASSAPDSRESELSKLVEGRAGTQFGSDLRISSPNGAWTHIRFDLWYATDEQLQRDMASGRQGELIEIFSQAAQEYAGAESEVRFHSHQHVREKCGGNYFNYYYFGFLR